MSAVPLHQQDPLANRLRALGDDIKTAKAMSHDLTHLLKRIDKESASLQEEGVTITLDLGPVGNNALATIRDLDQRHVFDRGRA